MTPRDTIGQAGDDPRRGIPERDEAGDQVVVGRDLSVEEVADACLAPALHGLARPNNRVKRILRQVGHDRTVRGRDAAVTGKDG